MELTEHIEKVNRKMFNKIRQTSDYIAAFFCEYCSPLQIRLYKTGFQKVCLRKLSIAFNLAISLNHLKYWKYIFS